MGILRLVRKRRVEDYRKTTRRIRENMNKLNSGDYRGEYEGKFLVRETILLAEKAKGISGKLQRDAGRCERLIEQLKEYEIPFEKLMVGVA